MRIITSLVIMSFLLLLSCGKIEKNEYTDVIIRNLDAMNSENLQAAMATIHEDSQLYDNTETMTEALFEAYDISYKLVSCKVVDKSPSEVSVEAKQITKKISGPEFINNMTVIRHVLRQSNGMWKIYESKIEDMRKI